MYSYTFDSATGGIILNSTPTGFSKEPRPVYAAEMDILGFDAYWDYDKQNDTPYMWAESNIYWYRGVQIAKIKGGDLYTKPELEPTVNENGLVPFGRQEGAPLQPIDIPAMCEANAELMQVIENVTVKRIVKEYEKFKDKLDIFHVAFSGGKDSAVLLDLTRKALPKGSFVVIFGDTGMEFPDTYKVVEETKLICEEEGTPFYEARSHLCINDSWALFGPPSRTLRWCCSVHKSTPQTLTMREITGKNNYTGMDFVGVRQSESVARSAYEYENFGKKQKGQYSYNPILEWTSAEIWLYIFSKNIFVNEAYKKGNSRAGCLCCPMSAGSSDYFRRYSYQEQVDSFVDIIKKMNNWDNYSDDELHSYITSGGWISRKSGRGISNNHLKYKEASKDGKIFFQLINPTSNWHEWIKTVKLKNIDYSIIDDSGAKVELVASEQAIKDNPTEAKYFKLALKKSAYCVGCRVCETNCKNGHLTFKNGKIEITDCIGCHECYEIPAGCHAYNSLKLPQGEKKMKTVNCFDDHAPKRDWMVSFFELQDSFFTDHTLGPNMFTHFKRFLRDAELIDGNRCTSFSKLVTNLGWETATALGLILVNLAYGNAQFEWYINNMDIDIFYDSTGMKDRLLSDEVKEKAASCIIKAYKRIVETPIGTTLNFGYVMDDDLVRTKCTIEDNRVLLYALYKFIEKCNMDKEFHLSYLFDEDVERDGVSPVRMFGLYDEEDLKSRLLGLSAAYPDFINATFTNDLKTITLREKTSQDVLDLFQEDM